MQKFSNKEVQRRCSTLARKMGFLLSSQKYSRGRSPKNRNVVGGVSCCATLSELPPRAKQVSRRSGSVANAPITDHIGYYRTPRTMSLRTVWKIGENQRRLPDPPAIENRPNLRSIQTNTNLSRKRCWRSHIL